jgi:hypothetical protein
MVFIVLASKNSNLQLIKMYSLRFSVKEGFYYQVYSKLFHFPKENKK